jgi:hypothetical protein
VHAIWFSIIVPALVAAPWIWPRLRAPKVWLALFVVALLGTAIWLGVDSVRFVEARGTAKSVGLRVLFMLLSETGKPVLPVLCGSFLAAIFSQHLIKQAIQKPNLATGEPLSAD